MTGRILRGFTGFAGVALACGVLAAGAQAASTTLYVDNTNSAAADSGNCQTQSTPCKTISYAVSQANTISSSAVTVDVVAGSYSEAVDLGLMPSSSTLNVTGGPDVTVTAPDGSSVFSATGTFPAGGKISLSHLTITAAQDATAIDDNGAGINLTDDTFSNNSDGVLETEGGNVIVGSTFVNDSSPGDGGAISNGGGITVYDDTFANDKSGNDGGAIFTETSATIENSTFVGDSASGGGGAIFNYYDATIKNNVFDDGAASGDNCVDNPINGGGGITDDGYNVADNSDCSMSTANHDVVGAPETGSGAVNLGSLQNNGGPTQTAAIGANSAAYHEVPVAECAPPIQKGSPVDAQADQRGVPRPQPPTSGDCDAGAYEYAPPAVTGISPTTGSPGTSVTITGYGFTLASGVKFGSTAATSFTVNSDTQITATAPAGSGTVDVTVTNPDGTSQTGSPDQFNYAVTASPTSLTADPAVLELLPSLKLLEGPTATLTSNGTPVSGATIAFTSKSGTAICSATTNAAGTASCGLSGVLPSLLSLGYHASYAGDTAHSSSTATGSLIVLAGTTLL